MITFPVTAETFIADQEKRAGRKFDDFQRELLGEYAGLYIEMKNDAGRASQEQKWWGERLTEQGYRWEVCHGWRSAVQTLEWYLTLKD